MKNILDGNQAFVCEQLKESIKLQVNDEKEGNVHKIDINYALKSLYEELLQKHYAVGVKLLVDSLRIIYEATQFKFHESEIIKSTELISFEGITGEQVSTNYVEVVTNLLFDVFNKNIDNPITKYLIAELSKSKHEGFVYIALFIYTSHPEMFKDDIYEIIVNRQVLSNATVLVEYQAVEALKNAFQLMSNDHKKKIIDKILSIDDKNEHKYNIDYLKIKLRNGHPIIDIDLHMGKALEVISIDELRKISWNGYQERQRIDRKFTPELLINTKPISTSTYVGWRSLTKEQGLRMSCKAWENSMLSYTYNPADMERPSLAGQCELFRIVVKESPDKFIKLIDKIILDNRILLAYPKAGMEGLIDAGRWDDAMNVLEGILRVIHNDVNSTERGFSIHSLLFALNDVSKQEVVPEIVIRLLCTTLVNTKEPEKDEHQEEKDVYNVGINQTRGNAGYLLVACAKEEKYKDEIFRTIESVASTASVYTRAAILLNMAVLNRFDKDRNVILFKKLMHDYNPRLMAMPIHNYNPLVYFVNYAVDSLMEFFKQATYYPECFREQVIILWLAWSHNNSDERIKMLLDKMCESCQDARISLLNFLSGLNKNVNEDAICYIKHFMAQQFDSAEMEKAFNDLFGQIDKWPKEIQYMITDTYVNSSLCKNQISNLLRFLGSYSTSDPIQTLKWLEKLPAKKISDNFYILNELLDVVIQSYNGIKKFNRENNQEELEHAMDLIDEIMQSPDNKYLISDFIYKLDNE